MSLVKQGDQLSAFPWVCTEERLMAKGMTLRDYFAAQAMTSVLAVNFADAKKDRAYDILTDADEDSGYSDLAQFVAAECYAMADAMLKARDE